MRIALLAILFLAACEPADPTIEDIATVQRRLQTRLARVTAVNASLSRALIAYEERLQECEAASVGKVGL